MKCLLVYTIPIQNESYCETIVDRFDDVDSMQEKAQDLLTQHGDDMKLDFAGMYHNEFIFRPTKVAVQWVMDVKN